MQNRKHVWINVLIIEYTVLTYKKQLCIYKKQHNNIGDKRKTSMV